MSNDIDVDLDQENLHMREVKSAVGSVGTKRTRIFDRWRNLYLGQFGS